MERFYNCKTVKTGLYKPHTLYLDCMSVSIIYYKRQVFPCDQVACATDKSGNTYKIYKTSTIYGNVGFIAIPDNPDKIKGFFPWL